MECIDDISEPEDMESCEWFIKKPFDANDFIKVINVCMYNILIFVLIIIIIVLLLLRL